MKSSPTHLLSLHYITPPTYTMNTNPYKLAFPTKLNDSFRATGLVSPATTSTNSTSVTPLTPMTPLTTPRTPAQILLGRNEQRSHRRLHEVAPHEAQRQQQQQLLALEILTGFVDSLESTVMEIAERECAGERVMGPGILRMCRDLAERVEELARELSLGVDRTGLYDLRLVEQSEHEPAVADVEESWAVAQAMDELAAVSAVDACSAVDASTRALPSLLDDVAASLRGISQEEAQELADVALEVAIMGVWTLRVVQRNMSRMLNASEVGVDAAGSRGGVGKHVPQTKTGEGVARNQLRVTWLHDQDVSHVINNGNSQGLGPLVEMLGEEEKKDENFNSINRAVTFSAVENVVGTPPKYFPQRYTPKLSPIPSSPSKTVSFATSNQHQYINSNNKFPSRRRVLWPPILPTIQQATQSCIHTAQDHPLPAIAVGLVCGPAAITTAAIVGPPILITDWAIQSSYNAMSDTPFIQSVEKAVANAFRVSRLALLCSKLAIKQGVSVGERQIQRRGGVAKIFSDVVDGAVDMAMHPVETVGMAWEGLFWMGGVVRDVVGFVGDAVTGGGELRMDIH